MGKKTFISKSNATKFDLIFRPGTDPSAAPEREWVEASRKVGIGRPDADRLAASVHIANTSGYTEGHPLSWLEEPERDTISEERRREIIGLGFPDDGYDYLKHLRQGHAAVATKAAELPKEAEDMLPEQAAGDSFGGPSVYIPAPDLEAPPEDYKAIDASRLTVHQAAENYDDASLIGGGASAFARELDTVRRRHQQEIDEMEKLMRQYESLENVDENGDLLENFVLTATEVGSGAEPLPERPRPSLPLVQAASPDAEDDASDWEEGSEASSSSGYHPGPEPSESKSFASTYWRPERTDRKANLSFIDERFDQLALEYDSDDIGELDQLEGDPSTRGVSTTDQFASVMDEFLAAHATQDHAHEGGHQYRSAAAASQRQEESAQDAALAAAALAKARERVRAMEEEEAEPGTARDKDILRVDERARDAWDCKSVLSMRSTQYNHPTRLDAGARSRRPREARQIQLSHKTGWPVKWKEEEAGRRDVAQQPAQASRPATAPPRKRDESAEDKKQRKEAVKDAKRQARANKKELKVMFKEEGRRQQKHDAGHMPPTVSLS